MTKEQLEKIVDNSRLQIEYWGFVNADFNYAALNMALQQLGLEHKSYWIRRATPYLRVGECTYTPEQILKIQLEKTTVPNTK